MKKNLFVILVTLHCLISNAQTGVDSLKKSGSDIPVINLKDLNGNGISTASFSNDGKPVIIVFWNSVHKFPAKELDALQEKYADWKKATGVKIIIISTDDSRTASRVKPLASAKGWDFEFYLDINSDFKRSMNVNFEPHTFLMNGSGKIVWNTVGFVEGNESLIYDELKKIKN